MIWIVVTIHLLLSLGLLWSAWQAWQLRLVLASMAEKIDGWAVSSQRGLSGSAPAILTGQRGAGALQEKYKALQPQLQRIRIIVTVFGRVRSIVETLGLTRLNLSPKTKVRKHKGSDRYGKRRW